MTTFDDRERAFEAKFAQDQDLEFKAVARRDKMLAAWAAEKMGLAEGGAEQYAQALIRADFKESGDEDVIRKIMQDFSAAGVQVREGEIRQKMHELLAQSREQLKTEG
ncbi:MAG TPA: DUF1476 domain-containing protein [Caulobacteraceae bacterium]|nr:DUF1476 domain-containing protein [Caulobacteraceae bacterium]